PAVAAPPAGARPPGRGGLVGSPQPGQRGRPIREGPHLQLQGEPGHRPSRRCHGARPRPGPRGRRTPRRAGRRPRRRRARRTARRRRVTTWASLRDDAERALTTAGLPSPAVDARWIVEDVAERGNGSLALTADEPAPPRAVRRVRDLVSRRARGEPLQYVLGAWAFRDLTLMVDARVLIPRPETEQTVEVALAE